MVQFTYGDDSLNPEKMEDNDRPVQFDRLHLHVSQVFPCPDEPYLLKDKLLLKIQKSLDESRFQSLLPNGKKFLAEITSFFEDIVETQVKTIEECKSEKYIQQRIWNSCRFTETQLDEFLRIALSKYTKALVEPGEAVGAIGAQSIGEPGTQMTLKVSMVLFREHCIPPSPTFLLHYSLVPCSIKRLSILQEFLQ